MKLLIILDKKVINYEYIKNYTTFQFFLLNTILLFCQNKILYYFPIFLFLELIFGEKTLQIFKKLNSLIYLIGDASFEEFMVFINNQ
jgi:hypothetical protein